MLLLPVMVMQGYMLKKNCTIKDKSDINAEGSVGGIVTAVGDIKLTDSHIKAAANDTHAAIMAKAGTITYNETDKKDDLFIKVPDNGRVKKKSGESAVYDNGKYARYVEFVKATLVKEIRFEIPVPYDGEKPCADVKITTVPAGAIKNDKFVEFFKAKELNGTLYDNFLVSDDGKTYEFLKSKDDVFIIDKYYGTDIPSQWIVELTIGAGGWNNDPEDTSQAIFDRNIAQFYSQNLKVYVNGILYEEKTTVKDKMNNTVGFSLGRCLGSIKKAKIDDIVAQEYTGKALTPEPKVTYGSKTLKKGTDYTLSYKSNTGSPTKKTAATVTVTGKGSYALSASKTFTIEHTKHVKDKGKTVKEPTVKETGTKEYHCTVCGKLLATEEIAKLPPEAETQPETQPEADTPQADAPLSPEKAISLKKAEKALKKVKGYKDPKSAKFGLLQAKAKKIGKNYVKLGWTKVQGAEYYVIYGNKCSKKNQYLKLTKAKASAKSKKIKKIAGKKLKKGTYYKFIIAAVAKDSKGVDKVIACSKSVHFITKGNKKYSDFTKVKLKTPKEVTIKAGETSKIKATQVKPKKLKVQQHRKLSFESNNTAVATVTKKGAVKGVSKGTAVIYVYAQNGLFATVSVTVE